MRSSSSSWAEADASARPASSPRMRSQQLLALGGRRRLGEARLQAADALQQLLALDRGRRLDEAGLELGDALGQERVVLRGLGERRLELGDALEQLLGLGGGVLGEVRLEAGDALQQLPALGGVLGRRHLVADALELLARLVGLALGRLGAGAAGLRLARGLLDLAGSSAGDLLELVDALQRRQQPARRPRRRRRGRRSSRPGRRGRGW